MQEKHLIATRSVLDTPEGVQLTFQLAGPAARAGAYVADLAFRGGIFAFIAITVSVAFENARGLSMATILVLLFLVEWAYGTLFEWMWNGRTPGKKVFKLRVIKTGGYPIGFYEAVIRNMLRFADAPFVMMYGVGLFVMMGSRKFQRLGDMAAGTFVVKEDIERVPYKPRNLQMVPVIPRAECRRGYHVSERTLDTVTRLFERSGYLSGPRRDAIAIVLAEPIARKLGFDLQSMPPEDRGARFLIRVIKTFSRTEQEENHDPMDFFRDDEDAEVAAPAGAGIMLDKSGGAR